MSSKSSSWSNDLKLYKELLGFKKIDNFLNVPQ